MYPRGNKIAPSRWCNTFTDALANWSTSVPSPRHAFSSSFASISFDCLYWLQHNNRVQKKTLELPAWTVGIVLSTHCERFHCSAVYSQIEQNRVNFYYKVHIRNTDGPMLESSSHRPNMCFWHCRKRHVWMLRLWSGRWQRVKNWQNSVKFWAKSVHDWRTSVLCTTMTGKFSRRQQMRLRIGQPWQSRERF